MNLEGACGPPAGERLDSKVSRLEFEVASVVLDRHHDSSQTCWALNAAGDGIILAVLGSSMTACDLRFARHRRDAVAAAPENQCCEIDLSLGFELHRSTMHEHERHLHRDKTPSRRRRTPSFSASWRPSASAGSGGRRSAAPNLALRLLILSPLVSRLGCGCQNRFGIPFGVVGEFTTHFRTYFSGD